LGKKKSKIMDASYQVKSNAKINLGLLILNKRNDDFHNLQSIFIEVNLYDIIFLHPSSKFKLTCNNQNIPIDEKNTIFKTYFKLYEKFNFKTHYEIFLEKNIPLEAGLGGGSSNAACIIKSINKLEKLKLQKKQMLNIAESIGSDVPFFIDGKIQFVEGRGEILKKCDTPFLKTIYIVLIIPSFTISTKWAFKKLKKNLEQPMNSNKFPALVNNIDWGVFKNDFEKIVGKTYPEIFEIKKLLYDNGALYSGLSGSGSTVFGIYNNKKLVKAVLSKFKKYTSFIVTPIQ